MRLPFQPEKLESMRARLPDALVTVYNPDTVKTGGVRPGQLRQNVFDFEDGIRCIVSLDLDPDENKKYLHLSFSSTVEMDVDKFLARVDEIPTQFWPDTVLVMDRDFATNCAIHTVYELPSELK